MKKLWLIIGCIVVISTFAAGNANMQQTEPRVSKASAEVTMPEGFVAEIFVVNLETAEDFIFDETGVLWVGLGPEGEVIRIEFNENTLLPIDIMTLPSDVSIVGLEQVFGLAFDQEGNLFIAEFCYGIPSCEGKVSMIEASYLEGPFPFNVSDIPSLNLTSGLGCPDGAAFAPSGSPFGTNLFVGDILVDLVDLERGEGGVTEINPSTGAIVAFTSFVDMIEEVIFSGDGQTMFAISPGGYKVFSMQHNKYPTVLASGFNRRPDAIAQGPGNEFGSDLYVGELSGNTLFRVNPSTGETTIFANLGSEFGGFEDIIFDQSGRMYILDGQVGQIVRISPVTLDEDDDNEG